jgi:hypothetical protein
MYHLNLAELQHCEAMLKIAIRNQRHLEPLRQLTIRLFAIRDALALVQDRNRPKDTVRETPDSTAIS